MEERKCKHELKNCPRCKQSFECKPGDIGNCQCTGIKLAAETQELISRKYHDCLCRDCLVDLTNQQVVFREKFGSSPH
ncbi:MAG: hypothetical protein EOO06_15760 [Chitinophagaceae bacterium]|nr:MAG: hypothetical protein EOO06_15760 [Chitinophagaceae bacterium]